MPRRVSKSSLAHQMISNPSFHEIPHLVESGPQASGERMNDGWDQDHRSTPRLRAFDFRPILKSRPACEGRHRDRGKSVVDINTSEKKFFAFEVAAAVWAIFVHD